jgi:hypothetical protein
MSYKPKPQSWDDIKPGDVIAWTETKWSYRLNRNTERPRRLLVRWVAGAHPNFGESTRIVWGVLLTKADQPHKGMNTYPLTDANHVSTGEMGHVAALSLDWITSLDRPSYVRDEAGEPVKADSMACLAMGDNGGAPTGRHAHLLADSVECNPAFQAPTTEPAAKPVKLTDPQWSAINDVSGLLWRGFFPDYVIKTNTSAALVGKGLITHIIYVNGYGRQWLTLAGFKAAGIDLATLVEQAHADAIVEHGVRLCDDEGYEPPYEYGPIDKAAVTSKPIDSLLNSGALPIVPPSPTLLELIDAHAKAAARGEYGRERAHALRAQIESRLAKAAALMPVGVREILDGHE